MHSKPANGPARGPDGARGGGRPLQALGSGLVWLLTWACLLGVGGALHAAEPAHVPIPGGLQGKTCFACHIGTAGVVLPSQERPHRYSMSEAFGTYLQSPHGRLRRLGDLRAPMCEDCHLTREWREILPQEHPASPIHPDNLPALCARCHGEGMRTVNVSEGSMHLELAQRSMRPGEPLAMRYGFLPGLTKRERAYFIGPFDVTGWINGFFVFITVGTLSAFTAYLLLDLYRKLRERRERQITEADHDRS